MRRKRLTLDNVISHYRESYKEKEKLTPEDKEKLLYWASLDRLHKDIESMKPLVLGGYPKMMYDCITPYYQWIATIFISMGIILTLLSIGGFFIPLLNSWTSYLIPAIVSVIFGIILVYFIRNVKR